MTTRSGTLDDEDYEAIAAAVMETARGRWFLDEYARRNRQADTTVILSAIDRLDQRLRRERTGDVTEDARERLMELALATETTRVAFDEHLAEARANGRDGAHEDVFGAVVAGARLATSDVLSAAEKVQEAAWILREHGADDQVCDALDQRATEIYLACTFQDAAHRQIATALGTLSKIDAEIGLLMDDLGMSRPTPRPAQPPDLVAKPAQPSPTGSVEASMADHDLFDADLVEEAASAPPESAPAAPPAPAPPVRDVATAPVASIVVGATALKIVEAPRPASAPAPEPIPVPTFAPMTQVDFAELSFAEKAALFA